MTPVYTLVYDGDCRVCTRTVGILRGWDRSGAVEFVPSRQAGVRERFPWIPAQAYEESIQLIEPGGVTWQGAAAIDRILDVLPRGRWLNWIFRIPLVRPLAERSYRWIARNRHRLGCGDHCQYRPQVPGAG